MAEGELGLEFGTFVRCRHVSLCLYMERWRLEANGNGGNGRGKDGERDIEGFIVRDCMGFKGKYWLFGCFCYICIASFFESIQNSNIKPSNWSFSLNIPPISGILLY